MPYDSKLRDAFVRLSEWHRSAVASGQEIIFRVTDG
jgi:hypothetical protein